MVPRVKEAYRDRAEMWQRMRWKSVKELCVYSRDREWFFEGPNDTTAVESSNDKSVFGVKNRSGNPIHPFIN